MAAPLPEDERERLAALGEYRLLDTAPEDAYDDIVRLAALICGTPIAAVSLVAAERVWFKSVLGLGVQEIPRDLAFCAHTILRRGLTVVPDTLADPRFADSPLVTGDLGIRFYAGAPLVNAGGHALGTLCVVDRAPRDLTAPQQDALRMLALQAVGQMDLARRVAAHERLGLILEATGDGVWERQPQTGAVFLSAQWKRMLGYEDHEVPDRYEEWLGRLHPEDAGRVVAELQAFLEGRERLYQTEYRLRHRDGAWRWVLSRGRAVRDDAGRATRVLGTTTDITAGQQARERDAQLLAVSGALGGALTTAEVADVILQAALPIFRAVMGLVVLLSADGTTLHTLQVVGVPPALSNPWRAFSVSARLPLADAVRERRLVVLLTDEQHGAAYPEHAEARSQAGGGALVAVPLLVGDRCVGGIGLTCPPEHCCAAEQQAFLWTLAGQCALALERARLYDEAARAREEALAEIAERRLAEEALRESERRLRLALASGELGTWQYDVAGREFVSLSNQCKAHYGLPPEAPATAEELLLATHPDDRELLRRTVLEAIQGGHDYRVEFRCVWPDGSLHWISTRGSLTPEGAGRGGLLIGVTQEVTDRKEREAEREWALAEAQERADRDPLTGLLNHRAFYNRLEEETRRAAREGTSLALAVLDLDNFKFFNDLYGHPVGDEVLRSVAERLRAICRPYDVVSRFGGDEFALLLVGVEAATHHEVEERLRAQLAGLNFLPERHDVAIPITLSLGVALFPDHGSERLDLVARADERLLHAKTGGEDGGRAAMLEGVEGFPLLDALVTAVDNKDRYTRRHSEDVMAHCLAIARQLGMGEADRRTLAVAALLHDVGKIGVPDRVLRKPGGLTEEEAEAVRRHAQMGAIIVQAVPGLEGTLGAIRHHHERWDGGGYPFGLRGEETPLPARLMAVADAFSAMTSDRPYRRGMGRGEALAILEAGAGTQWDPRCVQALLRAQRPEDEP